MPLDAIKKILQEAKLMGLEKVGLTGGEPFLNRRKLMQIAGFCKTDLGIPIHITIILMGHLLLKKMRNG